MNLEAVIAELTMQIKAAHADAQMAREAALRALTTSMEAEERMLALAARLENESAAQRAAISQVLGRAVGKDEDAVFEAARAKFERDHPTLYLADVWGAAPDWLRAMRDGPAGC